MVEKPYADTEMGGVGREFMTTHWSTIEASVKADEDRDLALIDSLIGRYWKPIYVYVRRKGYANEEAKDITQGFFHEVVLGRGLFEKADPAKGRFRSLLLNALNYYLLDVHRRESAKARIPKSKLRSMDDYEGSEMSEAVTMLTPEDAFAYSWVSTLLEHVIKQVQHHFEEVGKPTHWIVFHERTLLPILERAEAPSLESVCQAHGIENVQQASNMIATVRRRFQTAMKQALRSTVTSDEEAEEELNDIKRFLPRMTG